MKVFVTGATGFVGSAIVDELLRSGHSVLGLARTDSGAASLSATGASVLRGELTDLSILKKGATESDAVIHTAFVHDFADFAGSCATDKAAIEAMGSALAGSNKPFIVTSGTLGLAPNAVATEDMAVDPATAISPRAHSDVAALSFAAQGVRVSIVRLPPSVHGDGDHGFVPMLIGTARAKGVAGYIGDGANRWSAVHRLDAARLYRLVLEKGRPAANYHAIGDEAVSTMAIAEAIGRGLKMEATTLTLEEAKVHFGWIALPFSMDGPCSSKKTQEELGWTPTGLSLIADLDNGTYFKLRDA